MANIDFKIEKQIGLIAEKSKGWNKELNLVSWNGRDAKYDIREWGPDHESMGKGVTFTSDELRKLYEILKELFVDASDIPVNMDETDGMSLSALDIVSHA